MGMPAYEDTKTRGDAYVRITLRVPKNLTAEEKELFEKLASLKHPSHV
jgi:curved DNA-binding protein